MHYLEMYHKAKADVNSIGATLETESSNINEVRAALFELNTLISKLKDGVVKGRAVSSYNKLNAIVTKYSERLKVNAGRFSGIREIAPQADTAAQMLKNGSAVAFNAGAILALTAATGAVYAAVSGISAVIDPVKVTINKQADLIDMYINREINEAEYERRATALETELDAKSFFVQKEAGFSVVTAVISAGVIYGVYKSLKLSGILDKIMRVIR